MVFQSAIVRLLITKLVVPSYYLPALVLQRRRRQMNKRIFLERLRRANWQIPHPIFFKKVADFAQFVEIWRAKEIHSIIPTNMVHGESIPVSPFEIRGLRNRFDSLCKSGNPFALHFFSNDSSIVMKFDSLPSNETSEKKHMQVTIQKFEMYRCVCLRICPLIFETTIKKLCGVELTTETNSSLKISFFYDPKVIIPWSSFNDDDYLRAKSVTFYTQCSLKHPREPELLSTSMKKLCLAPHA